MNRNLVKVMMGLFVSAIFSLVGCGGGGDDNGIVAKSVTLSGTVATGAPVEGAVVTVTDSSGAVVGTSSAVPADGSYSLPLDPSAKAPFILKAELDNTAHYSVAAEAKDATVNISQVTDLIVARLSATGDPAAVSPTDITALSLATKSLETQTLLAPVLTAANVTTDPLNGTFTADGTGLDRVLDAVSVTIAPSGTFSNIEVAIKGLDAPMQFRSSASSLPALAAPTSSALPASGTSALIADFLALTTACYAVPAASRVDDVTAAAPALTSSACKSLFFNNEPTQYKDNGNGAGKGQDFSGMFTGATVTFSNGSYEFTRANGDLVIGYRWVDNIGNAQYDSTVVRNVSGSLKLVGNQYQYGGAVIPYAQYREFLNRPDYSYYSVGYLLKVPNTQLNGVALFDHVDVITPLGDTIKLIPIAGAANLGIASGIDTFFVRLRSEWAGNGPAGITAPRNFDTGLVFNPGNDVNEDALISVSAQSKWTFNYYLASAPSILAQTQAYRTKNRALSIGEYKAVKIASLTETTKTALINASSVNNRAVTPTSGGISVDWSVPSGALPPTSLMVWGKYANGTQIWDDSIGIKSTLRTGTVNCSTQGTSDTHCSDGNYAFGDIYHSLHLWARDSAAREFSHYYALYTSP